MSFHDLIFVAWFYIPIGLANASPVFVARIFKNYNHPIDGYKTFRGKRIFGDHKTVRGLVAGTVVAVVVTIIQFSIIQNNPISFQNFPENYFNGSPIFLGLLVGLGALLGDSVKSFFKRQIGIESGKSWFPFDQIDYVVGAILFSAVVLRLTLSQYFLLLVGGVVIHILTVLVGYWLGLRKHAI